MTEKANTSDQRKSNHLTSGHEVESKDQETSWHKSSSNDDKLLHCSSSNDDILDFSERVIQKNKSNETYESSNRTQYEERRSKLDNDSLTTASDGHHGFRPMTGEEVGQSSRTMVRKFRK